MDTSMQLPRTREQFTMWRLGYSLPTTRRTLVSLANHGYVNLHPHDVFKWSRWVQENFPEYVKYHASEHKGLLMMIAGVPVRYVYNRKRTGHA